MQKAKDIAAVQGKLSYQTADLSAFFIENLIRALNLTQAVQVKRPAAAGASPAKPTEGAANASSKSRDNKWPSPAENAGTIHPDEL